MKLFIYTCLIFLIIAVLTALKPSYSYAVQASNTSLTFFQSQTDVDNTYPVSCTGCAIPFSECWNDQTPGQSSCGNGCVDPSTGLAGGQSWAYYTFNNNNCRAVDASNGQCTAAFVFGTLACSTADKFNSSNPPVLNAGLCSCAVGGPYKTCCSNGSTVNATEIIYNPPNPAGPDGA